MHRLIHHHVRNSINKIRGKDTRLSTVAEMYDLGHKGYLTPAEQKLRELDTENTGHVTNQTAIKVMEETIKLKHANISLHRWIWGLMITILWMGCVTVAVSFWGAALAKDTEIKGSDAVMRVKNQPTPVTLNRKGTMQAYDMAELADGRRGACVPVNDLNSMFQQMSTGTRTNVRLAAGARDATSSVPDTSLVGLKAAGSQTTSEGVCYATVDGESLCYRFGDFCDDGDDNAPAGRRRLADLSPSAVAALHRHHFHASIKGWNLTHRMEEHNAVHTQRRRLSPWARYLADALDPIPLSLNLRISCTLVDTDNMVISDGQVTLSSYDLVDAADSKRGVGQSYATGKTLSGPACESEDEPNPDLCELQDFTAVLDTPMALTISVQCDTHATATPKLAACSLAAKDPNFRTFVDFHEFQADCTLPPSGGSEFEPVKITDPDVQIIDVIDDMEEELAKRRAAWGFTEGGLSRTAPRM